MSTISDATIPPGATVRFISDLHYGHERCEAPEPEALTPLLEGIHTLVVVGDLAETRRCDWQERGMALRQRLRDVCAAKGVQLLEISGNHDPDVPALLVRFYGGKVIAMHGHALYKEVAPWSWEYLNNKQKCRDLIASFSDSDTNLESRLELSRSMCQLTPPILRRPGGGNRYVRGFLHCFWPPQRPACIVWSWLTFVSRCRAFIRHFLPETQIAITGHFHRAGRWHRKGLEIVNTGAWFKHATPWYADMKDGEITGFHPVSDILTCEQPRAAR